MDALQKVSGWFLWCRALYIAPTPPPQTIASASYTVKLSPQPQRAFSLGLMNTKPSLNSSVA